MFIGCFIREACARMDEFMKRSRHEEKRGLRKMAQVDGQREALLEWREAKITEEAKRLTLGYGDEHDDEVDQVLLRVRSLTQDLVVLLDVVVTCAYKLDGPLMCAGRSYKCECISARGRRVEHRQSHGRDAAVSAG